MLPKISCLFVLISICMASVYIGGNGMAKIELLDCDFSQATVLFSSGQTEAELMRYGDEDFVRISMSEASPSSQIGFPELPVVRFFVEIPQGAQPSVEVFGVEARRINLVDYGLPKNVFPRQYPVPKIAGYVPEFVIDWQSYASQKPQFAVDAEIIDIFELRDHRIALVEIRPINYVPATGEIILIENAHVRINTPGADLNLTAKIKMQHRSLYFDKVVNPYIVNSAYYASFWVVPTEIEMIIITTSSFSSQLSNFVKWKKRKGFKVDFKTTAEIGTTTSAIKTYIQNQYNADDVDFVLLVGDVAQIPTYTGGSSGSSSDNPYSELAGSDYIPDCFLGRWSLNSTSQVTEFAGRNLTYEKYGFGSGNVWTLGVCLPASDDGTYHTLCENTQRYVAYNRYIPYGYTRVDTIWAYYGGTGSQVISSTNAGIMTLLYSGHGSYDSWAGPTVTQSMVQGLTNAGKYPFVCSFACQTGMFGEYSECFMETWIRQTNKGAIGALGASDYSYWYEDDVFERRAIDSVFVREWMFIGGIRLKGLMAVYSGYPSSAEYYFDMYNLLGDPSIALWWGTPRNLTVSFPGIVAPGSGTINFTVTSDGSPVDTALVCITNDGSLHNSAYTNMSGTVSLSYSGITAGETLRVTVTAYNKIPFEGYILAASNRPFLIYETRVIQDDGGAGSLGDGDTIADAGERLALWVSLRNSGTETASGVSATMSESSVYANITDNSASYGTIAAGAVDMASDPFIAQLIGTPPDQTLINLNLTITDAPGTTWTDAFSINVRAPALDMQSRTFSDMGDGDGFFEPGEQVGLAITLRNDGGETGRSITGTISESDPYITIAVGSSNFANIPPAGTTTNSPAYRISISPSCPTPYFARIIHTATEGRGYSCCDTLTLLVGSGGLYDDAEGGLSLWSAAFPWHITDYRWNSPGHSFYAGDESWAYPFQYHDTTNAALLTVNPIILPPSPVLTFWHYYELEAGYDSCFVEASSNGGTSWNRILSYTGPSLGWKFGYYNLSSFGSAGSEMFLRFRLITDTGVRNHGWFVDDISVKSSATAYLGAADVFPRAGKPGETFTFKVTYASPNGTAPTSMTVYIDDSPYTMSSYTGAITTGIVYSYSTTLSAGTHRFYFVANVGGSEIRFPATGNLSGPIIGTPLFEYDLGTSNGGFTTQSFSYYQDWQWGVPTYGPAGVPYGTSCWATRLATTYRDSSQSRLKSPVVSLPNDGGRHYLVIWHWYRAQPNTTTLLHDGGNVKLAVDGGTPFVIFPQAGYDGHASQYNFLTRYEPVYGDTMNAFWQEEAFDITPWAGRSVQVCFDFGSSSRNNDAGWYINYVSFFSSVASEIESPTKPEIPEKIVISATPNPFNSKCKISVSLPQIEENANMRIFDISGHLITEAQINSPYAEFLWDADDLPAGIFLVRISAGKLVETKSIILLK